MAKKKGWFDRLKRFFSSDPKTKSEKNERRKRWLLWRIRSKYTPALPAPSLGKGRLLREAEDEQSKHAMAVAIATAAAAEAAVAAAQAAAEVVRLTGKPSYLRNQETAAIKIQSAFRGYLARKALRALKGLVMLQALIRGQAVRRQTTATLKGLQSLIKLQSHARVSRSRTSEDHEGCEFKDIIYMNPDELINTKGLKNERRWDNSTLSKEEISGIVKSRREAMLKRLRAMEYATFHQERRNLQKPSTPTTKEILADDPTNRWTWLEQWVGTQPVDKEVLENCKTTPGKILPERQYEVHSGANSLECQVNEKEEEAQLRYLARRSFNRSRRTPIGDDGSFSSSPLFPSYMASTASTKARFRSMSTPKQRTAATDISSDRSSVHANRIASPVPSIVSEVSLNRASKSPLVHQQSPRLKGQPVPVKSHRSPNYFSFDSKFSSLNWDQFDALR